MPTMAEAIRDAVKHAGGRATRHQIRAYIDEHYAGQWQPATLTAHLYACVVNNRKAYEHHPHAPRFLYKYPDGTFELYDEKRHGPNIWDPATQSMEPEDVAPETTDASVSLERDVEDALVNNLAAIEPGLMFLERQVSTPVGRVDILARHSDGITTVIEIKVGEAKHGAVGQVAKYMGRYAKEGRVRGILVSNDFSEGAESAASMIPGLQLYRFRVRFDFEQVPAAPSVK